VGSTFLFISHRLAWFSNFDSYSRPVVNWTIYAFVLSLSLVVTGAAGYHVALLPCRSPARRLYYWVLLPSAVDILAIIGFASFRSSSRLLPAKSVFEQSASHTGWRAFVETAVNLGPGIQFASAGLVLVAIFFVLLLRGSATAPIGLADTSPSFQAGSENDHHRTMIFVWSMICLLPLTELVDYAFMLAVWGHSLLRYLDVQPTAWVTTLVAALSLLSLVLLAMGKDGRKSLRRSLRLSEIKYPLLAIFFPAAIASVWPLLNYVHDRILWASYQWGRFEPPTLSAYFGAATIALLRYFLLALPEEIAWRGYLQPRFIRRYGLMRGIFLVGVVWGAFHFSGDFALYHSWTHTTTHLVSRVSGTIFLSCPFAWLTLKSRSILPATIAHAVYNMTVVGGVILIVNPWWLGPLLWGGLGYVLFRFDPPGAEETTEPIKGVAPEQPAGDSLQSSESESRG
jgi:membrane protease YdiL (CAAX protease family)